MKSSPLARRSAEQIQNEISIDGVLDKEAAAAIIDRELKSLRDSLDWIVSGTAHWSNKAAKAALADATPEEPAPIPVDRLGETEIGRQNAASWENIAKRRGHKS